MGNEDIPTPLLNALAKEHTRRLLLHLVAAEGAVRYSEARRAVAISPPEFQRALNRLEDTGLVVIRAPAQDPKAQRRQRRQVVLIEASPLGEFLAGYWREINEQFRKRARKEHILRAVQALSAEG